MSRKLFSTLMTLLFAIGLMGIASAKGQDSVTLTGHIVDKACSARFANKENPQVASAAHTKNCALMEGCAKSGFGVFADGKYVEFDEKGTAMAKAALEKSTKDKGATFKVSGKMVDGKLAVASITESE
ncbi:MAG: hypothetical protein IPM55_07680 [Acidobacteria bacterium]|nr:hypothetical protein [Acidobacteriota bacterium]